MAQAAVDRAMTINDQLSEAWASQSLLYDDADRKRAALQKAVELNPNNAIAWMWLGLAIPYSEAREGTKVGQKAYALDPLHPAILASLSLRYNVLAEFDEAQRVAQELIDIDPDFYLGYSTMALNKRWQGRWDDVILWSKKAFERNPELSWNTAQIAEFYVRLGDLQQAEAWAQRAVASGPMNLWAAWSLATVRYESGDTEQALALLNESLEQNPDSEGRQANLAYLELLTGNYARALELYETVMSAGAGVGSWRLTDSNDIYAPYYAFLLRETGDIDRSRAVTDELLRRMDAFDTGGWRNFINTKLRALAYAVRQDDKRAISSLRAAFEQGYSGECWLDHDPLWEQLRHDTTFVALLDEMRAKRQAMLESLAAEGN